MFLDVFTGAALYKEEQIRNQEPYIYIKKWFYSVIFLNTNILVHTDNIFLIGQIISFRVKVENTHPSTLG